MPDQLYAELVGRALCALHTVPEGDRPARWVAAIDKATTQLRKKGMLLSAHFPGPFDDFTAVRPVSSQIPMFSEVEARLEKASTVAEVPELPTLAYAARPSEGVVTNILRLLSGPVDGPLGGKETEVPTLRIGAHIAAVSRSTAIANAVINRCLFLLDQRERVATASDLIMVAVHACAAHSSPEGYGKTLDNVVARCAFAIKEAEDLSNFDLILEVLSIRDERLTPAVARARAITRTKIGRD